MSGMERWAVVSVRCLSGSARIDAGTRAVLGVMHAHMGGSHLFHTFHAAHAPFAKSSSSLMNIMGLAAGVESIRKFTSSQRNPAEAGDKHLTCTCMCSSQPIPPYNRCSKIHKTPPAPSLQKGT